MMPASRAEQLFKAESSLTARGARSMADFESSPEAMAIAAPALEAAALPPPLALFPRAFHGEPALALVVSGLAEDAAAFGFTSPVGAEVLRKSRLAAGLAPAELGNRRRRASPRGGCVAWGYAVVQWTATAAPLGDNAPEDQRALLDAVAASSAGTRGFVVYQTTAAAALAEPVPLGEGAPTLESAPAAVAQWAEVNLDGLATLGGELMRTARRALEASARLPGGAMLLHVTHSLCAPCLVRGHWPLGPRTVAPLSDAPRRNALHAGGHPSMILVSSRARAAYRPRRGTLQEWRRQLSRAPPWQPAPTGGAVALSAEGCFQFVLPPLSEASAAAPRRGQRADFVRVVDAILGGGGLRDLRDCDAVMGRLLGSTLGRMGRRLAAEMRARSQRPLSRSTALKGRARLDLACMVLHRQIRAPSTLKGDVFREVLLDASPFLKREVLAVRETLLRFSSTDAGSPPIVERRRFPAVVLAHGFCSAADKAMAMLHAVWLEYGPGEAALAAFCSSVRGVPTDFGPESLVANSLTILPHFYKRRPRPEEQGAFLFPLALRLPGWSHACDTIVKHVVVTAIPWYPAWSQELKLLGAFFGIRSYVDLLHAMLERKGQAADAERLKRNPETFQTWRWGSLVRWCRAARERRVALEGGWAPGLFRGSSAALAAAEKLASRSDDAVRFWARVDLVVAVLGMIEDLRTWGGGCACHEAQRQAGERVACDVAGRRAREAWDRVCAAATALDRLVAGAPFDAATASLAPLGELSVLHRAAAVAKGQVVLRFGFLDQLPYLLIRSRNPEVAARCLAEHDACVGAGRSVHRLSVHFLGRGSVLREDVAAVARGGLPTERLARALQPFEWATLDESLIEGEHRSLRVEAQRAHNVTHAHAVATLRMKQNAALIQEAERVEGGAAAAERAWRRAKLLAAPRGADVHRHTPREVRALSWRAVRQKIFRLDDSAREAGVSLRPLFKESVTDLRVPVEDYERLCLDYMDKYTEAGCLYVLPVEADDNWSALVASTRPEHPMPRFEALQAEAIEAAHPGRLIFQILEKRPERFKVVRGDAASAATRGWLVQEYGCWAPTSRKDSLDVFPHGSPVVSDPTRLAPWAVVRSCLRRFRVEGPSDVEGCTLVRLDGLAGPVPGESILELPAAVCLERLADSGWAGGRALDSPHETHLDRQFAFWRRAAWAPSYFRSLLVLRDLLDSGLSALHTGQAEAYYLAAMLAKNKAEVFPNLRVAVYSALADGKSLEEAEGAGSGAIVARRCPPAVRAGRGQAPLALGDGRISDGEFETDGEVAPLTFPVGGGGVRFSGGASEDEAQRAEDGDSFESPSPARVDARLRTGGARSSRDAEQAPDTQRGDDASLAAMKQRWEASGIPDEVAGSRLRLEARYRLDGRLLYCRRRVRCCNPGHQDCSKSRSVAIASPFGDWGAVAYLAAWVEAGQPGGRAAASRDEHAAYNPSEADQEAWLSARGQ